MCKYVGSFSLALQSHRAWLASRASLTFSNTILRLLVDKMLYLKLLDAKCVAHYAACYTINFNLYINIIYYSDNHGYHYIWYVRNGPGQRLRTIDNAVFNRSFGKKLGAIQLQFQPSRKYNRQIQHFHCTKTLHVLYRVTQIFLYMQRVCNTLYRWIFHLFAFLTPAILHTLTFYYCVYHRVHGILVRAYVAIQKLWAASSMQSKKGNFQAQKLYTT